MMLKAAIVLLGLSACIAAECDTGLWGDNCNNVCIGCKKNIGCTQATGKCDTGECEAGYRTEADSCVPECFGVAGAGGCENGGECVAPNYCICGKSGAQVVGVSGQYPDKSGEMVEGTQCISLRKTGIKGAFISLAVMCISIGFCGFIELQRNKGKSKKD